MPPMFTFSRPSTTPAQMPAARNVEIRARQVPLDEAHEAARAVDVIRRADQPQDVAAFQPRPRFARHHLRAALQGLHVHAARAGRPVARSPSVRPIAAAFVTTDVGALHGDRQKGGFVELRTDFSFRVQKTAAACGHDEAIATLQTLGGADRCTL